MTYEEAERLVLVTYEKDPEAAKWLVGNKSKLLLETHSIGEAFVWKNTPQGHRFWWDIEDIINGVER